MNSKDFQENALKTESIPKEFTLTYDSVITVMRIAVEAAKAVDVIKKALYYGKPIDIEKYVATLRSLSDASLAMRALAAEGVHLPNPVPIDDADYIQDIRVLHGALGMFTEAGEMVEAVAKYAGDMAGGGFDEVNFREEMGDSDWYKAILHDALGVSEEETRAVVIAKLQKRYPDKFTTEAAINRDLAGERELLEKAVA